MATATFRGVPFYYENANKYPYIDKISVGEDDYKTDFVYQFVKNKFFYQWDNRNTSCFDNIIGAPEKYTNYDNSCQPFDETAYESRSDEVELNLIDCQFLNWIGKYNMNTNFINIEFHEAVYPIKLCMHVIDNSDNLVRIWAKNYDNQWFMLWHKGDGSCLQRDLTLFLLPLRLCKFKTVMLRLKFQNSILSFNCTKLAAVMLIGTSELILPKRPNQDLAYLLKYIKNSSRWILGKIPYLDIGYEDIYYLQKEFRKYFIISKRNTESFHKCEHEYKHVSQSPKQEYGCSLLKDESKCKKFKENIQFSSDESKELSHSNFSMLPNEIILEIFKKLDLQSLRCMSQVNKRLNILSWDPWFYKNLNMRDTHFTCWNSDIATKFRYYAPRCEYLSQLDLSFCLFLVSEFIDFLDTCGRQLTHLKLNYCRSINDLAIRKISEISKNLKQLDLNYCGEDITSEGVSYLERLEFLERLHLQEIDYIEIYTLCNILRNNRQMRDLNIAGVLIGTPTVDVVAIELKNSCPNLESINFKGENSITWQGIDALAECKNLQELNIGGCVSYNWSSDSFHRLLSSCQHLENINLGNFQGITDRDLTTLMLCKNLKYLDLSNILVPSDICSEILLKCSKLEKIDLYCTGIKKSLIDQWNEEYQHILIIHDNVV